MERIGLIIAQAKTEWHPGEGKRFAKYAQAYQREIDDLVANAAHRDPRVTAIRLETAKQMAESLAALQALL